MWLTPCVLLTVMIHKRLQEQAEGKVPVLKNEPAGLVLPGE
jgi:hypothetical protein